jgi:hypothetical protein
VGVLKSKSPWRGFASITLTSCFRTRCWTVSLTRSGRDFELIGWWN